MKYMGLAAILMSLFFTAACNTMEGLGQDVQKGGENLEEAAQDSK